MRSYRACFKASSGSGTATRSSCRNIATSAVLANKTQPGSVDDKISHPRTELDPGTAGLLDDIQLGMGSGHRSMRRKRPLIYGDDLPTTQDVGSQSGRDAQQLAREDDAEVDFLASILMNEPEELEALDEVARYAGDDIFAAMAGSDGDSNLVFEREDRLSPAAAFGSKRVGMVVIPQELNNAIQARVDGESVD